MHLPGQPTPKQGLLLLATVSCLVALVALLYVMNPGRGLPYQDRAAAGEADEWTAYAGNWRVVRGEIRNDSTDPGAKFLTGSSHNNNYSVEADVQLLGDGDAGLTIRVNEAERGADAYNGYYAGLRTRDQKLVLGKAEFGWSEFPSAKMPGGVAPGQWFHLKLSAYECTISATASQLDTGNTQTVTAHDSQCFARGRFGLRSLLSGGVWRHIQARQLTPGDAAALASAALPAGARAAAAEEGAGPVAATPVAATPVAATPTQPHSVPLVDRPIQPIQSLRLLSTTRPARASVRGSVIHTEPLYIQDSTGGALVVATQNVRLREGEEVEVEGDVYPIGLTAAIRNATVVSKGGSLRTKPPLSLTADQAATGLYNAMFIEVQGTVGEISTTDGRASLELSDGGQTFRAIADSVATTPYFRGLEKGSTLRLRGVCLVDEGFTQGSVPFVLLINSADNIKVLAGPPWWSVGHLIELAVVMLALGSAVHLLFSRAEAWRLRAVIDERERLAHEIHDTLAQSFAGIGFQLRAIRNKVAKRKSDLDSTALIEELNRTCELVKQSHDEARRSIVTLRPDASEARGLIEALEQTARQMVGGAPVVVETSVLGHVRSVPLRVLDSLFRIGQESIANAVQHSHPTRLHICAEYSATSISLSIEDDGAGFPVSPNREGFGLSGIRRRTESIRGTLAIKTVPGEGTRILVRVPMHSHRFDRWRLVSAIKDEEPSSTHVS